MARPRQIDQELVQKAQTVVAQATDLQELRSAQAILFPALLGTTLEQTASMLGVGRATVARLQARFRERCRAGCPVQSRHGGRRNVLMSVEEEQAFLEPWAEQAKSGGVFNSRLEVFVGQLASGMMAGRFTGRASLVLSGTINTAMVVLVTPVKFSATFL